MNVLVRQQFNSRLHCRKAITFSSSNCMKWSRSQCISHLQKPSSTHAFFHVIATLGTVLAPPIATQPPGQQRGTSLLSLFRTSPSPPYPRFLFPCIISRYSLLVGFALVFSVYYLNCVVCKVWSFLFEVDTCKMSTRERVLIIVQVYGFSASIGCSRDLLRTEGVGVVSGNVSWWA